MLTVSIGVTASSFFIMNLDDDYEEFLMSGIERERYDWVQSEVTAKALMNKSNNPLLLAVKVSSFII